ncbi:hypothetical protein BFW38_11615 [Terasakiispira papahanaumokuakeensis]|uniref:DUF883 domain-containing protein n=1 Tax=Terasakiispira papahanaumokuakeensis TaxID=197479 RepID=A0A1E2VAT2_9GAMM|nr:hypothetical protein [Terasakiispira papahanaumokuakeensis]ODC04081.1 hypothetical protein BFW38_11615 [Terasakiispira papahanaumokuakeensis]
MESKATQEDYEQLKADMQLLRDDLAKLSKTVVEGQKDHISQLREELQREGSAALKKARHHADESIERVRDNSQKVIGEVEKKIEDRPFLTVVLVFLAGMLLGKWFDR